jgi:hypothetical protein
MADAIVYRFLAAAPSGATAPRAGLVHSIEIRSLRTLGARGGIC